MKRDDQYEYLLKKGGVGEVRDFAPFMDFTINWMERDVRGALDRVCQYLKTNKNISEEELNNLRDEFYKKFKEKSKSPLMEK